MEKQNKINLSSSELITLASSMAICLSQKLSPSDLCLLRQFLSTLTSNLTLIEAKDKFCNFKK